MDVDTRSPTVLRNAIEQLLRPLFRLLLRNSVSFSAFEDMAKRVYVDVALKDFRIPGKKATTSRVAVLSGLTRKDVHRILAEPPDQGADGSARYNRATRVLTGWARDTDFLDKKGRPLELGTDGEGGFTALVRRYSGDMPARAVLDELVRVGAVKRLDDGRLQLVTHGYVPQHSEVDKLGILGSDVADLIDTIDHNLQFGATDPRFQRKVMYHSIPASALPAFRQLSGRQAQGLLEKLDRWLADHDRVDSSAVRETALARVGVSIYYFEERLEPNELQGEAP
ncbi:MAG: DUF6502 family protein [Caldimonas sp.]